MAVEFLNQIFTTLRTTNMLPILVISSVVALAGLLFLCLLVRYAPIFAIAGTATLVMLLANFPKAMPNDIVDVVIYSGFGLLAFMMFCYEFILWRQSRKMRLIAQRSAIRHAQRRRAALQRRGRWPA